MHVTHSTSIIHRDLKPANNLFSRKADAARPGPKARKDRYPTRGVSADEYEPKITDFGLAKQLNAQTGNTQTGTVMGTPSYMAPEQARGQISLLGPVTDVYALSALLYELLTGQPPFRGGGADGRDTGRAATPGGRRGPRGGGEGPPRGRAGAKADRESPRARNPGARGSGPGARQSRGGPGPGRDRPQAGAAGPP